MKKYGVLLSLVALAFLLVCSVGAAENVSYFNESKNITFEGVKFTIPEGFGQSKMDADFEELGSDGQTCFYINDCNGEIIITVISDWMGMSLEELHQDGANKTTINGHEGWSYKDNGLHHFGYVDDDKGIIVAVTNKTRLNQVIL